MAQPRANGTPELQNQNYTASIKDTNGLFILPPVQTYSPRGIESKSWGYDVNGLIVESGWNEKVNQYRIINDTKALVSERVQAIDTRAVYIIRDSRTFVEAYQGFADGQREIDEIYSLIPTILSFAGGAPGFILSTAGKLLSITQKPENYKELMYQIKKKLILMESELKFLGILKNNLTGEYKKLDLRNQDFVNQDFVTETNVPERSANTGSTNAILLILIIFFIALFKRKKRK